MKSLLLSVLMVSVLAGCGGKSTPDGAKSEALFSFTEQGGTPNTLNGLWGTSETNNKGEKVELRLQFSATEMVAAGRCTQNGKTGTVSITVPIEVLPGKITMKESRRDQLIDGELDCIVEAKQGDVMFYVITGHKMTATLNRKAAEFTKLRD